ncbi:MAG: hypothetical protein K9M97_05545 [Akkermansiaceae bacterium]|nr:hypothetical protein [Akkermansiaceae bacterium]
MKPVRKMPASPQQITKQGVGVLLKDPEFMRAVIERRFITRDCGDPTPGACAKADPGNSEFLGWLVSRSALTDAVMLARTPSAGFARLDDSWSIDIEALENWKKSYRDDPASRDGRLPAVGGRVRSASSGHGQSRRDGSN